MYTLNILLSDGWTCCLNVEYQMYVYLFCSMIVPCLNAFALSGRVNIICCGITQGVASLALGYVLHWAFSPPLLNPKLQLKISSNALAAEICAGPHNRLLRR